MVRNFSILPLLFVAFFLTEASVLSAQENEAESPTAAIEAPSEPETAAPAEVPVETAMDATEQGAISETEDVYVPEVKASRACVIVTVDLAGNDEDTESYRTILENAIIVKLEDLGFEIVSSADWKLAQISLGISDQEMISGIKARQVGKAVGARVVATGAYGITDDRLIFQVKLYDTQQGNLIDGTFSETRIGMTVYTVIDRAISRLSANLQEFRDAEAPAIAGKPMPASFLTIESPDEGAEVLLAGVDPVATVESGKADLSHIPFRLMSAIDIEVQKPGYHSRMQSVHLEDEEMLLEFPALRKQSQWAVYADWTLGQLLGVGLGGRYYFIEDYTFLGMHEYFFVQSDFKSNSNLVYHNDLRLSFGQYVIFDHHFPFRFWFETGFGAYFTWFEVKNMPIYFDPYLEILGYGMEWNMPWFSIYYKQSFLFTLDFGTGLLGQNWLFSDDYGPSQSVGVVLRL